MSTHRFCQSCVRFALSIALGTLGSLAVADDQAEADQLHSPTHRQVRVIEPKVDGKTPKLHTIATTADGKLLAAVGGQSMQYVMSGSSYTTKFTEEPAFVLMLDSEGQTLKQWDLELTPTAITAASDGAIYVGGSGRIARLADDGSVAVMVDSPHVGSVEELRKNTAESIRSSRSRMSESFSGQIETLQDRVEKIEAKDEGDRSRLEDAQLKAFKTQLEMLEKLAGSQGDDEAEVDDSQLDAAVMRTMSITSMAASEEDVFLCAMDPSRGGYSIWRMNRDLETDSSELIMDGLRGCCGQMDIQCCDENLLVSENTKFRVGIYDRHGRTQGNFGRRDRTSRAGFGSCCNPMNSLSMSDGTVLTAESSIGHIKRFDTEGNLVAYIGKATIGAGCKHCALGYDESNDIYYMMYEDKNSICVLANRESTPMTLAEKQRQQRQVDFLTRASGLWSLKEDAQQKESSFFASFGGGRGGSSRHAVSSLEVGADGSAKILEGMYKAYGDKSQLELMDESDADSDSVGFALAIDQVRFLQGTWKFDDDDTAVLAFQGQPPITMTRSAEAGSSPTKCAGAGCANENCKEADCPQAGADQTIAAITTAIAGVDQASTDLGSGFVELEFPRKELDDHETVLEVVRRFTKPTFEYRLLSKKQLGENQEAKLNEMGAEGWEFCGRVGKKMMFKRVRSLETTEAE